MPKSFFRKIALISLLLNLVQTEIRAQLEDTVGNELGRLRAIFFSKEANFQIQKDTTNDKTVLTVISKYRPLNQLDTTSFQDDYFNAKAALLKKQIGLSAKGDFIQNVGSSFADIEDNIFYRRRYQLGLEWDILKNGFLDNRLELQGLPAQKAYYQYLEYYKNSKMDFGPKMNECLFWFNSKKIFILNERETLLQRQLKAAQKLFSLKKITKEQVLSIQTRIAEIQGMRGIYGSYNDHLVPGHDSNFYALDVPLFDLNYDFFFDQLSSANFMDSISILLQQTVSQKRKWYNDVSLKTFVRYNYFDLITTNPANRAFFSVGANVGVPIPFTVKEQRRLDQANLLRREYDLNKQQSDKRLEILNEAYEFRYHLKQYVLFHQKKVMQLEALRRERVKSKLLDADFNPLHALELLDNLFQVDIELLDLKQNLYLRLLRMHDKQVEVSIDKMIVPMNLPNFFDLEDKVKRGMYVWSSAFKTEDPKFIEEYLIYNSVDRIYLAVQENDSNISQKLTLIKELASHEIQVELLIGKNKLLESSNIAGDIQKLISVYPSGSYSAIHLDIEPHTRDDWKVNEAALLEKLVSQTRIMKKYCSDNSLELTMDLPLHYEESVLDTLIQLANRVHFMCYENVKPDYLERKLNRYSDVKEKVSFALRAEDFKTKEEVEQLITLLVEKTGITNCDLHDLTRFIKLDKTTLNPNAKY